jgi:hypothetical protein
MIKVCLEVDGKEIELMTVSDKVPLKDVVKFALEDILGIKPPREEDQNDR